MEYDISFEDQVQELINSYNKRLTVQKAVWEGFDKEKGELEERVCGAFENILREIGTFRSSFGENSESGAKVLGFTVDYNPQFKTFSIQILRMQFPDGRILDHNDPLTHDICLGGYDKGITSLDFHPLLGDFKTQYRIGSIKFPRNRCCPHK